MTMRHSSAAVKLRVGIDNACAVLRLNVLKGAFFSASKTVPVSAWKSPTFDLLVFVSSTFTDTQLEQNFLMDELLFNLRQ